MAAFGYFFLPLIQLKPNRLASGINYNLFELQGDARYIALFVLALLPLVLAFQKIRNRRGWSLVGVGVLVILLTLLLPAVAAQDLLTNAEALLDPDVSLRNPRVLTSSAMALGLLGGYIVMFAGLLDLQSEGIASWARNTISFFMLLSVVLIFTSGSIDVYSILVEFEARGATLGQRLVEHFVFVSLSLVAGLVIGIGLGLWAARDERVEPIILYAVGIIQTIPSLALFGILLVPLARIGDQPFSNVLIVFFVTLILGIASLVGYSRIQNRLQGTLQAAGLIGSLLVLLIPAALFVVITITFGFGVLLNILQTDDLLTPFFLVMGTFAFSLIAAVLGNRGTNDTRQQVWRYANLGSLAVGAVGLLALLLISGQRELANETLAELTVRDLGVSGIGTAPAIIALTLYSLLPLVRNTYAGLNNVDPAIIDSGRGMGMTPAQIFFNIELPLAFPIIMAGVRNAGIALVGIAAVASIIGAGALGDFILLGINTTSIDLILLGAIPAIFLAVALDALLQLIESLLTSPGIKRVTSS